MEIKLLGPLVATANGTSIAPTATKPRQLLALLAISSAEGVTLPLLIEEIWGNDPPRSAATTLQTYILQLRRLLGDALGPDSAHHVKAVLATRFGGYLLNLRQGEVDVHEFERLAAAGRVALREGDPLAASRLLTRALSMWRGPALADVRLGRVLEIEVSRLTESRHGALENRITADLRLGRHAEVLGELTALVRQHPMNESLYNLYILALYRCGRPDDALRAYRELRRTLTDRLGLEPSPRLQRLHQAVLCSDPALDRLDRLEFAEFDNLAG
ncbi:AfsR/SARP family transcriptional regulator [Streptomyces sp.]|uniref:AfsR/SARP family transcriptional regulator n=1 Tax=Streptomyces sp. TaxID=1931 RepID=UPI002F42307B